MRIGIPRGLLYYHYFPLWKTFFDHFGCEVVVSPRTNEEILSSGCASVIGDICLPVKVFCGHVRALVNGCDYLFIPSVHSMQEKVYNCPKFIGLPDIVRASIPGCPPILDPDIDVNKGPKSINETIEKFSRMFTPDAHQARKAVGRALKAHHEYARQMETHKIRPPEAIGRIFPDLYEGPDPDGVNAALTIAVIGHRYVLHDSHISYRLIQRLHELGAKTVFAEAVNEATLRESMTELVDQKYWGFEEEIIGAGAYYMRSNVDGIIAVECFGCGPDSLMVDLIQRGARRFNKPFLNLVLDEHSSEGGLVTRIEAFVDMVKRARSRPARAVVPRLVGEEQDGIKAMGLPNMGVIGPAFRGPAKLLDVRLIIPPITKRTISLGTRNSPEFACLPFKVILGSFIECLEDGADTLFMVTSSNACRMGYYSKVQEQILRDMGYKFSFLRHRSSDRGFLGVLRTIRRCTNRAPWSRVVKAYVIGTSKLKALDDLDRKASRDRAMELQKGQIERIRQRAVQAIESAETLSQLRRVVRSHFEEMDRVPRDHTYEPLKVGIIGEMFVVVEPFVNFNLEVELGKMGVEATRNRASYLSEWTRFTSYLSALNAEKAKLEKYARPYLKRDVGGHGLESVAEKVRGARMGYDGIVHLAPLTCMPEVIAQNILPTTEEEIPVLTMFCDEQLTETGVLTRLEAFVDLLKRRREYSRRKIGIS